MKKTLVIGASTDPGRYSYLAINALRAKHHAVAAIGRQEGQVGDVAITSKNPPLADIDTVTLYINPAIQTSYYEYIIALKPNRVIFNPGTENPEFEMLLGQHNIKALEACTLVLLSTRQF